MAVEGSLSNSRQLSIFSTGMNNRGGSSISPAGNQGLLLSSDVNSGAIPEYRAAGAALIQRIAKKIESIDMIAAVEVLKNDSSAGRLTYPPSEIQNKLYILGSKVDGRQAYHRLTNAAIRQKSKTLGRRIGEGWR